MTEKCRSCPIYESDACKCKDCNDICKKQPIDSAKKNESMENNQSACGKESFFEGLMSELRNCSNTELILLFKALQKEQFRRQSFGRRAKCSKITIKKNKSNKSIKYHRKNDSTEH